MTEDNKLNIIIQEEAAFKLRHGRKEQAARLLKRHGSIEALVRLIQTAAHADIEKAEAYAKQLKPLPSLEKTSSAEKGPNVGATETYEAKRKSKYLKGFDPANPEKWIPKRERSSYKPKKKDKRAAHIRASQQRAVIVIRSQTSQLIQKFLPRSNPTNVSSLLFP